VISELFDQDDFERYNERRANQGDAKPEYFADVSLPWRVSTSLFSEPG